MFENKIKETRFFIPDAEVFANDQHYGVFERNRDKFLVSHQKTNGFSFFEFNENFFEENVKLKASTKLSVPEEDGVICAIKEALENGHFSIAKSLKIKNNDLFLSTWAKAFKVTILKIGDDIEIIVSVLLASSFKEEGIAKLNQCLELGIKEAKAKLESDPDAEYYEEFIAEFEVV